MNILDTRDLQTRLDELEALRNAATLAQNELNDFDPDRTDVAPDDEAWFEKKRELEDALENAVTEFGEDEQKELEELERLSNEISSFRDGEAMIDKDDFEEYAQELAEDIGAIDRNASWPLQHIDWTAAAEALADDYTEVSYLGTDYYVRA